ncbi:uncharacterized protein F4817DRAFT_319167 [Daldinia loculata]|uniref:uncharacterized protein n=1 Tax=Daldinia loculata TaxID=103429 RepID=UPI0020C271EF|nr:uncharacterized protein F4817DRAFT_319167 [Daldinia loculata]KAI1644146.1 hypothetical protein F4817DRAFT_319167 [Daldinia loculata]
MASKLYHRQLQYPNLLDFIPYIENIGDDKDRFAAEVAIIRDAYQCAKANEESFDKLLQYVAEDVRAHKAAGYSYDAFQDLFRDEITFQKAYRSDKERKAKSLHAINHSWRHELDALSWVRCLPDRLRGSRSFLDALKSFAKCVWSWDEAKGRMNYQIRRRLMQRGRGIRLDKEITTSDLRAARNGVLGIATGRGKGSLILPYEDIDPGWLVANGLEVNCFGIIDTQLHDDNTRTSGAFEAEVTAFEGQSHAETTSKLLPKAPTPIGEGGNTIITSNPDEATAKIYQRPLTAENLGVNDVSSSEESSIFVNSVDNNASNTAPLKPPKPLPNSASTQERASSSLRLQPDDT